MTTTSNPILALITPVLTQVLTQIKTAAANVTANPTIENLNSQIVELDLEALNPTQLSGVSIASAAQEVSNIVDALEAHLNSATASPSAAQTALVPPAVLTTAI